MVYNAVYYDERFTFLFADEAGISWSLFAGHVRSHFAHVDATGECRPCRAWRKFDASPIERTKDSYSRIETYTIERLLSLDGSESLRPRASIFSL